MTPEQRTRAAHAAAERMERRGLTQQDLAEAAGIARKTLRAFLTGQRWPRVAVRTSIEQVLAWPTGELARQARDGVEALAAYSVEELTAEIERRSRRRRSKAAT